MPSTIKAAALEATVLLQAFVAGIQTLKFYWSGNRRYDWAGYETRVVASIFSLLLLFTILIQLRLSSPNRKQTFRLELVKSGLVTLLWVWLLVFKWVVWGGSGGSGTVHRIVESVVSVVFRGIIFYSTLIVAWKSEDGRISLREEAGSLLPH